MKESIRQRLQRGRAPRPPWYDPHTWSGALTVLAAITGVLWAIQIVNAADDYDLDRYGLKPRDVDGLAGIVTQPFLHASWTHLLSNTAPLILIGALVLRSGVRTWAIVSAIVIVGGGIGTWLIGPSHAVIVGASGVVFGWLGYLVARAYFARRIAWILEAVVVLFFFGTLLYGLLPTLHSSISWQAHLCGFLGGIGAGALLHLGGDSRSRRGTAVS